RPVPGSWTLIQPRTIAPDLFLASCAFFVYFDRGSSKNPPQRLIVQALAAGCVVLLPPSLADPFGEAVVSVDLGAVSRVVQDFATRPEAFRAEVDRGLQFAAGMDGASLFGARGAGEANDVPE